MTKDNCLHKNLEAKMSIGNVSLDDPNKMNYEGYIFTAIVGASYHDGVYVCKDCQRQLRINIATLL